MQKGELRSEKFTSVIPEQFSLLTSPSAFSIHRPPGGIVLAQRVPREELPPGVLLHLTGGRPIRQDP